MLTARSTSARLSAESSNARARGHIDADAMDPTETRAGSRGRAAVEKIRRGAQPGGAPLSLSSGAAMAAESEGSPMAGSELGARRSFYRHQAAALFKSAAAFHRSGQAGGLTSCS